MTRSSTRRPWRRWLVLVLLLVALGAGAFGVAMWRAPFATSAWAGRLSLRAAGFSPGTAAAPRGPVAYLAAGSGPLLAFLHGANDQGSTWARIAPAFADRYRVVVADLAGHGQSAPADGPLALADLVAGVEAVVEAERSGGPAILVGNSLGGFLALVHALDHPGEVALVVSVNGGVVRGGDTEVAGLLLPRTRDEARRAVDALLSPRSARVPDFVLDDLVRRAPTSPLARLMTGPASAADAWSIDDRLGALETPVALIWGADDRLMPLAYAEQSRAALPDATLDVIPECGHVPQRECPARLLTPLETALARVVR